MSALHPISPRPARALIHARVVIGLALIALLIGCKSPAGNEKSPPHAHSKEIAEKARGQIEGGVKGQSIEADRDVVVSALIKVLLQEDHLTHKKLDDAVSKDAFDRYLKSLDPEKYYLLKADVDALSPFSSMIDDQLATGDLTLAVEGDRRLKARLEVVKAVVEARLAEPFDLTIEESFETDGEKRVHCESEESLKERWRKALKYQVIRRIDQLRKADEAAVEARAAEQPSPESPPPVAPDDAPPSVDPPTPDNAPPTAGGEEEAPVVRSLVALEAAAREELKGVYATRFKRLEQRDHFDRLEAFINAVMGVYDPHSRYLPPARKENFDIRMSGRLEGIGAQLSEDEQYIKVVRIVPGSASWREGQLEADDIILAVAQDRADPVDVVGMRLRDVVRLIRGKKGTKVNLTVKKPDERVVVVPIVRDVVKLEATYAKGAIIEREGSAGKTGYIDLPSFYGEGGKRKDKGPPRTCGGDIRALLEGYEAAGIDRVILDLRGNGGGYLNEARKISGLFFTSGPVVQTRSDEGDVHSLDDPDDDLVFKGDVVVMVDRFSASASEIVAGALQDYGRAVIVGPPQTHGKGTVQSLVNLDPLAPDDARKRLAPLGIIKLTKQQFFRVNGASTQHRGIAPDVMVPDAYAHIESGERHLDFSIPWSALEPVKFEPWPRAWDPASLSQKSLARQAQHADFIRVLKRTETLRGIRESTVVSLNFETWSKRRAEEQARLDALTPDIDDQPVLLTSERVDYDGAIARRDALLKEEADAGENARKTGQRDNDGWEKKLTRDAYVDEAIQVLDDMRVE